MTEQAVKETKVSDATALWVSKRLGTIALAHECKNLTPRDEYGRKLPMYAVVHLALKEYIERHSGKAAKRFGPGVEP